MGVYLKELFIYGNVDWLKKEGVTAILWFSEVDFTVILTH